MPDNRSIGPDGLIEPDCTECNDNAGYYDCGGAWVPCPKCSPSAE